jgi:cadmium resistance protein CadD (predicted permease)
MTVLGTAAIVFAITNVDAFVVLTLLFAASRSTGVPRLAQIVAGQYLGFMAWMAVCVLAAAGLRLVPDAWVGLLGVLPIALGLHGLLCARHGDPTYVPATGTLSVAVLTIANGVDNVAVYVLHFISLSPSDEALTIAMFFVLLAVWCVAAALIGSHKKVSALVGAAGRWLIPAIFIAIGAWVVIRSGILAKLPALTSSACAINPRQRQWLCRW